jgi:hypothetical protein
MVLLVAILFLAPVWPYGVHTKLPVKSLIYCAWQMAKWPEVQIARFRSGSLILFACP